MSVTDAAARGFAGRRALVTGASSGVGREIGRGLAARGAELVLPVRDLERGRRAVDAIRESVPDARVELRELDLARLGSVRALTAALLAEDRSLDLLVLNAGVALVGDPVRRVTPDGFELHFQTNFLSHAALCLGLLPLLERGRARVVVQGSLASAVVGVRWDDLQFEHRYGPLRAYGSSKTALGLFGVELARRAPALAVGLSHPGVVPGSAIAAEIRERVWGWLRDAVVHRVGNSPARAAETALVALETARPGTPGDIPVGIAPGRWAQMAGPPRARRPFRRLLDADAAGRVWRLAAELLERESEWSLGESNP